MLCAVDASMSVSACIRLPYHSCFRLSLSAMLSVPACLLQLGLLAPCCRLLAASTVNYARLKRQAAVNVLDAGDMMAFSISSSADTHGGRESRLLVSEGDDPAAGAPPDLDARGSSAESSSDEAGFVNLSSNESQVNSTQFASLVKQSMAEELNASAMNESTPPPPPYANVTTTEPPMVQPLAEPSSSKSGGGGGAEPQSLASLDCQVSDWSEWIACGRPDSDSVYRSFVTTRTRVVTHPVSKGGVLCPALEEVRACEANGDMHWMPKPY
eukprot:TRINITY_DN32851_c0_g1_i1.p1 TRINITY_DN32851_c0_g1~~TRINITY_DN32851_c0_g1_i1.p1  ORF type:complete len:295 (+),score=31.39 TRINITY_DN32851_c0_g1_i1:76-885(+)